ncbi:MAG: hypothetical protein K2Y23_08940 [Cyanobacteria bacterium]|nr:hypothetical protein [Cyanobacteriota bacterium]
MSKRKDGGLACGASTFVFVASIQADRLFDWKAGTRCLSCDETFVIKRGAPAPVLKVGTEIVGAVCSDCLSPDSRARLAAMRGEVPGR